MLQDLSARHFVQQLKSSYLPFSNAFEPMLTVLEVEKLQGQFSQAAVRRPASTWRVFLMQRPYQIAAGLILGLGLASAYQTYTEVDRSNWMVQVAEYQQLYVRDTVQNSVMTAVQQKSLELRLGDALGTALTISDLSEDQLVFVRGQVLQVNNRPLIQLVCLPEQGRPIALCITPRQTDSSAPSAGSARGLAMVHWNDDVNSFVLIGDHATEQLMRMARNARAQIEAVRKVSG